MAGVRLMAGSASGRCSGDGRSASDGGMCPLSGGAPREGRYGS